MNKSICNLSLAAATPTITKPNTQKVHQSLPSFIDTPSPIIHKMRSNRCFSFNPCKKILQAFKFKLKKPLFIKSRNQTRPTKTSKKKRFSSLRSIFRSRKSRGGGEMDRVMELKSFSDAGHYQRAPVSSPLTPAYVKMVRVKKNVSGEDDAEDACRSFENYLVEMIVEEGKMRDLSDVEELLYCWKNLKSPVFVDLVCRFYGELCKNLFSNTNEEDDTHSIV